MEKYYKKLMNNKNTSIARFVDTLFALIFLLAISFCFSLIKLKSFMAAGIISVCVMVIAFTGLKKLRDYKAAKFKKKLDAAIKDKLVLETLSFSKEADVEIKGYVKIEDDVYEDESRKKARLIRIYPQSVLTPKELLEYINSNYDKVIATCTFDDDCYLLSKRLGVELLDKNYLLKNALLDIDESQIEREIASEIKEIGEMKKRRKSASFARERWSRYLIACLLLVGVSGFMGRFKIIYIAFGGMCMSFCFLSLMLSKAE